jgi:hypothetical protein
MARLWRVFLRVKSQNYSDIQTRAATRMEHPKGGAEHAKIVDPKFSFGK